MASLADYLRSEVAKADAQKEAQAKALSDYVKNQQVLEALGQEDTSKKKPGIVNRLFGALGVLGRPGALVRAGVLEAVGRPTEELKRTQGLDQIMSILSGKTNVTGAQVNEALFPGLRSKKSDSMLEKIGKGAAGLATDIITDPISYVAAPASISRKAAAETLLNVANKAEFVDELAKVSGKGAGLIDELVAATPLDRAAEIQRGAVKALEEAGNVPGANKLAEAAGAPLETIEMVGKKAVAAQQAADRMSQALYTKGRTGLLKELEAMTGSRDAALKVFKTLPEDVRGGLVLANPITGKPFESATGEYTRLFGTGQGKSLGALGEPLNKVRQGLGVLGNPITRNFSGQAGNILADVKTAAFREAAPRTAERAGFAGAEAEVKAAPRFIDYTSVKKATAERAIKRTEIQAMTDSARKAAQAAGAKFEGADAVEFGSHFQDAFFTPGIFDDVAGAAPAVRSEAAQSGIDTAKALREEFDRIYAEAEKAGLDLGNIGSSYSPLMLKESAFQKMRKLGTATSDTNVYRMEMGRGSYIEFNLDEEAAKAIGWSDPKNPGVVYRSPKAVNDKLAEKAVAEATAAGKSAEEIAKIAEDARIYIEDPNLIVQRYGNYVANAAATKRFTDVLRSTGTVIKDVPRARKLLEEWKTSTFAAALTNLDPIVRKQFVEYADNVMEEMKAMDIPDALVSDARNAVVTAKAAREAEFALNGKSALYDTLDNEYVNATNNLYDALDVRLTAATTPAEKAAVEAQQKLFDEAFDKLDTLESQLFTYFENRNSIEELIEKIGMLDREDPASFALVKDLYDAFGNMRTSLPDDFFDKLVKTQKELITGEGFTRLRNQLLRNEMEPGAIARGLVEQGYEAMKPGTANAFANLYADSSVIEAINYIYKGAEDTNSWKRLLNVYVDPLLGAWKLAATTGRGPAFVINNIMGGMFNNWIGGVSGEYHLMSLAALTKVQKRAKMLQKMHPEKTLFDVQRMAEKAVMDELNRTVVNGRGLGELFQEFNRLGGFDQTQVSAATQMALRESPTGGMAASFEDFSPKNARKRTYAEPAAGKAEQAVRAITDFTTTNPVQTWMTDLAQQSEVYLRFAAFLDGFKKYGDFDAAMGKVKMLHFDYGDLGPGEEWMRRLVPFYTWTRNNVPLQFRTVLMQPGKIQRAVKAQQTANGLFAAEGDDSWLNEVAPEWVTGKGGVITKFGVGAGKLALTPNLPYTGINDVTTAQGLLGMLGPQIKAPMEIIQNRNFETGAPLNKPMLDTILSNITPYYTTGRNVLTAANLPVSELTGRNIPFAEQGREAQRLTSLLGLPALAGMQSVAVKPETIGSELSRRGSRQYEKINAAAADLGVDTDWIRRNLDKGIDPKTLAMLIQAGAGRTPEALGVPAKEKRISEARRQRALAAIASMGQ